MEFCPNPKPKEERKHTYSVSIHPAICYEENFVLFQKFDKAQFDKDRQKDDLEGFLTNSPLVDENDDQVKRKIY